ncbi:TetR/AcrR family transcriptional regulator [Agarilytica rhodophyticola]|uniref:TetR/AcrR family transcriptional regulator n=1 Tax=Agarilytica rhodophyticola TaxID=1737490 RepID=UPI001C20115A|nr:TetR/AcrR family transcriptional regulator [Agarilytica rhodophyticola]
MTTPKMGRPRQFDPDKALRDAMHVFWEKGYDGASMGDLTRAMGINRPSLYAAFGDKYALYLKSIDCYISDNACAPLVAFDAEKNITEAVRAFLKTSIECATGRSEGKLGDFLGSCVSTNSGGLEGIQERLQASIAQTDERLEQRFNLEKENGVLAENFPSLERARLMYDLRQGHIFRARSGIKRNTMLEDIEYRVKIVLL